jgi:mRNA interferase RelE/StbE
MKYEPVFTAEFVKSIQRIPKIDQRRIIKKLEWFCSQDLPGIWLVQLVKFTDAEYRIRIGDYRVLCDLDSINNKLILHRVGHRREIYES